MLNYIRVLPRDLFNEAKLLKCLGQLELLRIDGKCNQFLEITHASDLYGGFFVSQDESDGSISCSNIGISCGGNPIKVFCGLNARDAYPLQFEYADHAGRVLTDDGQAITEEFRALLKMLRYG